MSNEVWNDLSNAQQNNLNSYKDNSSNERSVQFHNTQKSGGKDDQGNDKIPNQVTSASFGFSAGMKREMESTNLAGISKKKTCSYTKQ